ncbi:MAG: NUDIX domain-containing protein [Candidatus Pacebacteria bacterium]|nr:NUDIX domain-containing protein [Candidatus Paceibacterota bacterium]
MVKPPGRFQVSMGAIIEHPTEDKILLLKRNLKADFSPGIWEEITGRIDQHEDPYEGLKREVMEEAGIEIEVIKPLTIFHLYRGKKIPENELVGIIFWCKAKSEKVEISGEHTEFRWLSPEEALRLVDHEGVKNDIEAYIREKA